MIAPSTIRVVFCGEKPLAERCLRFLNGIGGVEIVAACTRKAGKVWWGRQVFREACEELRIPIVPRAKLVNLSFDVLLSVLYPFVIEPEAIAAARKLAVNLHEAPLPRWRGCNAASHAILAGDTEFGTTLHVLAPQLDAGEVLAERRFPIAPDETVKELYLRTQEVSAALFAETIGPLLRTGQVPRPAPHDEPISCHPRSSLADGKRIDAAAGCAEAYRLIRALDFLPWEPAYLQRDGRKKYAFVGDSVGRDRGVLAAMPHRVAPRTFGDLLDENAPAVVVDGLPRPVVLCDETTYRQAYELM